MSSFGSLVSVVATIIFAYIIFNIFSRSNTGINTPTANSINANNDVKSNPWRIASFFDNELRFSLIETFKQLEWAVASPAPEHCFPSKPKQS